MSRKLLTLLFTAVVALSFVSTVAMADVAKGQKLFIKKLKKDCGISGAVFAGKYTQAEWKAIQDAGKLNEKIAEICPAAKPLKERHIPYVYDFVYNFASDSGNVPS